MIQEKIQAGKAWLGAMNESRRLMVSGLIGFASLVVWYLVLDHPVRLLKSKNTKIAEEMAVQQNEIQAATVAMEAKLQQKQLTSVEMQQLLMRVKTLVASTPTVDVLRNQLTRSMMNPKGIQFAGLTISPPTPWLPRNLRGISLPAGADRIQLYRVEIHFKAGYLETEAYLNYLSGLAWHIEWQSLNYQVTEYPEADVTVVFSLAGMENNLL